VASLTEGAFALSPVKPDWTDSSELLGYEPLTGDFRPGALLRFAKKASEDPGTQYFHLLDEMNIARVEYYFAEVLSILEDRWRTADGVIVSNPLISVGGAPGSGQWSGVRMPANLVLVGSVNMDETTHAFSRKVLDRAFVLEFADVQLDLIGSIVPVETRKWAPAIWANRYLSLAEVPNPRPAAVGDTITALTEINEILRPLQAQVGYRVRDEVALFSLNASECISSFVTSEGATVDPLDLAICMKVLPRLGGGGQSLKRALEAIRAWALDANGLGRQFVMCAARVQQMSEKLDDEGFTSYWL
jgi:5-methylcytosine-specific restriction endonuclease McrBC GTP-binding regulatory subunit McrB